MYLKELQLSDGLEGSRRESAEDVKDGIKNDSKGNSRHGSAVNDGYFALTTQRDRAPWE